jgi:hypothetical protein
LSGWCNGPLEFHHHQHGSKLSSNDKCTVLIQDVATFQPLPLSGNMHTLTFVAVPAGHNPFAGQPASSTLTFDGIVFVSKAAAWVAGFHSA